MAAAQAHQSGPQWGLFVLSLLALIASVVGLLAAVSTVGLSAGGAGFAVEPWHVAVVLAGAVGGAILAMFGLVLFAL